MLAAEQARTRATQVRALVSTAKQARTSMNQGPRTVWNVMKRVPLVNSS